MWGLIQSYYVIIRLFYLFSEFHWERAYIRIQKNITPIIMLVQILTEISLMKWAMIMAYYW